MKPSIPTIFERIFDYSLIVFVVISTLFYLPAPNNLPPVAKVEFMYNIQILFLRYGAIFLFALSLFMKPRRNFVSYTVPSFLIWVIVLAVFFNFSSIVARAGILNLFIGVLIYKLVYEHASLDGIKNYAIWLYWLLVANLVLCLFQSVNLDPIFAHVRPDLMPLDDEVGFMRLKATLGELATIISPLLFLLSPWLLIISLPLLYFSESSTAVATFGIVTAFLLYFRMKDFKWKGKNVGLWLFWALMSGVAVIGAYYILCIDMPGGQFTERFKVWLAAFGHAIRTSPYFGLGLSSFAQTGFWTSQGPHNPEHLVWSWAHNEYLQVLYELGIGGLVILILYMKERVKDFIRFFADREIQVLFGSFLAIAMIAFFHFNFHIAKLAGLSVFLLALFHAKIIERKQNETLL